MSSVADAEMYHGVNNGLNKDIDQIEGPWSPEEDEMLDNLVKKHNRKWSLIGKSIPGRSEQSCMLRWLSIQLLFTAQEDRMLQNLIEKHGQNWSLISKFVPGKSAQSCESRWLSLQRPFMPVEEELLHNLVEKHGPNWSLISKSIPGSSDMSCRLKWETLKWKSSLMNTEDLTVVGGVIRGQAPSISDMARGNMSSGGTHSYSRDQSAPSWNALYKRDSSPTMIDSDNVQAFVGSKFGRNDFSEVSSKGIVQEKGHYKESVNRLLDYQLRG